MFSRFFIHRPVFATVLSVLITLSGALSFSTLPLSQFPYVTPPTVQVDCSYPGASADEVAQSIAAPLEQQVNGVEDMLYMSSQSTSDGSYTLTVSFKPGTDLNLAHVRVMNRVNLAEPNLPDVVRATGVTVRRRSPEIVLTVSLNSPDGSFDQLYMSNYALTRVRDEMLRISGIAEVTIFGQRDYAMRIWLDPDRLAGRSLTAADVVTALQSQNATVPAGQVGHMEGAIGPAFQIPIRTVGRLSTPEEFGAVVVRSEPNGSVIRVRDVARIDLASKSDDIVNKFNRKPTIGLAVFLEADANALETADAIKVRVEKLKADLPKGIIAEIGYDTTPFIRDSIREVFNTLRDSILLVAIVVLVFLGSWRAALIPLAAVPVAIIGTFAAMAACGYSLNNLTLFGLVLAVGIVVDDAIVVVEAVEHQIAKGFSPKEATARAMENVSGPIIAVGAVLAAVFIPCMFIPGIVGSFFRQFALTITVSTGISTLNSLTLSPALAAVLLRNRSRRRDPLTWLLDHTLGWFFRLFGWGFDRAGRGYVWIVRGLLKWPVLVLLLLVYAGLIGGTVRMYPRMPQGFIPAQDQGYLIASIQLPDASSIERTQAAMDEITNLALESKGIRHVNAVAGNSFILSAYGSNFGSMFIILDPFKDRLDPQLHADKIAERFRADVEKRVPGALVTVFGAPPVPRLGRAGGFRFMVEDRGDVGAHELQAQTDRLIAEAKKMKADLGKTDENGNPILSPVLGNTFTVYKANSPELMLDVDRDACFVRGVNPADVYATLQATTGAQYVNDFNRFGRTWQVRVQAEGHFRNRTNDVYRLMVRNEDGDMVPLGGVVKMRPSVGPLVVTRYNMYPAATVNGNVAAGVSSGTAIAMLEQLADKEFPQSRMAYEWTELTFLEKLSQNEGMQIFGLSVAFVFLVLAALYESWAFPLAVILVVPMCVVSSVAGVAIAGQEINVFTQVGFVVLIGLACKNAILIVEFAKRRRDDGVDRRTAVLEACKLRFRPILMTSVAFILGTLPLVLAKGAGAEMRHVLGTAVFGGMIGVTAFGIFLTPVFFVLVDRFTSSRLYRHPWIAKASNGGQYMLGFRFVRPMARRAWRAVPTRYARRARVPAACQHPRVSRYNPRA